MNLITTGSDVNVSWISLISSIVIGFTSITPLLSDVTAIYLFSP